MLSSDKQDLDDDQRYHKMGSLRWGKGRALPYGTLLSVDFDI